MRSCLLALLLALVAALPLAGQTQVAPIRDLYFGVVIRGVQTTVAPTDPVKSGQFYVRYVLNGRVQIRFTLPANLPRVGGGGNMPISFSNTDGVAKGTAPSSVPVTFNPRAVVNLRLQSSPDFNLWLGGRVNPAAGQATGTYRGTIILNVTFF